MEVAHKWSDDAVDTEIDRLISRRASQDRRPDPDEEHELWRQSVRAHNARICEENRQAWCCEYHQEQAARHRAVLEALIASHEEKAAKLMDVQPEGA